MTPRMTQAWEYAQSLDMMCVTHVKYIGFGRWRGCRYKRDGWRQEFFYFSSSEF